MQHVMCHTAESNSDIHQQVLQTEEHDSIFFFLDSCTTHTIIKDLKFFVEIQSPLGLLDLTQQILATDMDLPYY